GLHAPYAGRHRHQRQDQRRRIRPLHRPLHPLECRAGRVLRNRRRHHELQRTMSRLKAILGTAASAVAVIILTFAVPLSMGWMQWDVLVDMAKGGAWVDMTLHRLAPYLLEHLTVMGMYVCLLAIIYRVMRRSGGAA